MGILLEMEAKAGLDRIKNVELERGGDVYKCRVASANGKSESATGWGVNARFRNRFDS